MEWVRVDLPQPEYIDSAFQVTYISIGFSCSNASCCSLRLLDLPFAVSPGCWIAALVAKTRSFAFCMDTSSSINVHKSGKLQCAMGKSIQMCSIHTPKSIQTCSMHTPKSTQMCSIHTSQSIQMCSIHTSKSTKMCSIHTSKRMVAASKKTHADGLYDKVLVRIVSK